MAWLPILLASLLLVSDALAATPPDGSCVISPIGEAPPSEHTDPWSDEDWASDILAKSSGSDPIEFDFSHNPEHDPEGHRIRSHFFVWLLEQANRCFEGRTIIIKNVRVQGDVLVANLDFTQPLEFEWVTFEGIFRIYKSNFGAPVTIHKSAFAERFDVSESRFAQLLLLRDNHGGSITLQNNELLSSLVFANNAVESIMVEFNLLHGNTNVTNNQVTHVVRLVSNAHVTRQLERGFVDLEPSTTAVAIQVFGNHIGGNLNVAPVLVDPHIRNIQLAQNRVDGAMRVELPFLLQLDMHDGATRFAPALSTHGSLSVENTTIGSHLAIVRYPVEFLQEDLGGFGPLASRQFLEARWDGLPEAQQRMLLCPTDSYCRMSMAQGCDDLCAVGEHEQPSSAPLQQATEDGSQCEREVSGASAFLIDLTNVKTLAFTWGLEHDCLVRWHGPGFNYEHWSTYYIDWMRQQHGANGDNGSWRSEIVRNIKGWRAQMMSDDYQSLHTISTYLARLGEITDSREYLEEARSARLSRGPGESNILEVFQAGIIKAYLWPTGHGARPEYALYWLFAVWLAGVVVYWLYSRLWIPYLQPIARRRCSDRLPGFARWIWASDEPDAAQQQEPGAQPPQEPETQRQYQMQEARAHFRYEAAREPDPIPQRARGRNMARAPSPTPKRWSKLAVVYALFFPPKAQPVRGFQQYDHGKEPDHFSLVGFSLDALLPVVNLHAFDNYFPRNRAVRLFSFLQRLFGWWMITAFVTSATILAQ